MNEKELKSKLEAKKREIQAIEAEYLRMKSARQLDAFVNELLCSNNLLEVITTEKLTCDDCKLFATKISASLSDIFDTYAADDVHKNQFLRERKNQNRKRKNADKADPVAAANMTNNDSYPIKETEQSRTY